MIKRFFDDIRKISIPNFMEFIKNITIISAILLFTAIIFGIVISVCLKIFSYLLFL